MTTPAVPRILPGDASDAARTHAWCVRLPEGATSVPHPKWSELTGLAMPKSPGARPVLRVENLRERADSPAALGRLSTELHLPLDPGTDVRFTVLGYADGPSDFIVTAYRDVLDATSLHLLCEAVSGGRDLAELTSPRRYEPPSASPDLDVLTRWREADFSRQVAWAEGDRAASDGTGVTQVSLCAESSTHVVARLAVAAAIVLGRYEGQSSPMVGAVVGDPARPNGALGAYDFATLLDCALSGTADMRQLVTHAARHLSDPRNRCTPAEYASLTRSTGTRLLVGVLAEAADGYLPCQTAPFPLTMFPRRRTDGSLALETHHRLSDVDHAAANRFTRHVATVFEQLRRADRPLAPDDIELLDAEEQAALVGLGRPRTRLSWQPERIDALFVAKAAEYPDAVAVSCAGRELTYGQLRERAQRCAAGLRSYGVRAGDRVAVCLDRSEDLIVSFLAVLLADAVYVPMDPAYPVHRLVYTVRDADAQVVVTELDALRDAAAVRTAGMADLLAAGGTAVPPPPEGGADAPAYIIYTSGSTGRPKGVSVQHRGVAALIAATRDDFGLSPDDAWTLFHSTAFDVSVWEIWGALLTGGKLVVVPYWTSRSPDELHQLLRDERITVLNQTPTAFAALMDSDGRSSEGAVVRLAILAGERLDTRTLAGWVNRYPDCRVVNMYGPTETTVFVTAHTVRTADVIVENPSVGRPIPGWHVYVLDDRQRLLPLGGLGEIHIGGVGVAQGYVNQIELTERRFVPDPWAGGRMYRSGDRGRLRPDGSVEFLGRLDGQVKLRGYRIELDEIRQVLLEDPTVRSAAVVLEEGQQDSADSHLSAYVVMAYGDPADVRRRAALKLPDYMVPATVRALDSLPLTVNGKLDTRRLPAAATRTPSPDGLVEPKAPGPLDHAVAEAWAQVLHVPVGPDDDVFELGANSLHAMRLVRAMRDRGAAVQLTDLYRHRTVSRLARALRARDAAAAPDIGGETA